MKRKLTAGQTSVSLPVFIQDTSSTTGGGLSGVTEASSGLVIEYRRQGQSSWTTGTPVTKTLGTFTAWGIVADGALAGAYEVDLPDAAYAAGARFVVIRIRGVANMLPCLIEIELDAFNYQVATQPVNLTQVAGQTASASGTVTFPNATLASTTNITAGTITTATNLTNLPAIPNNWLTAAGIATGAFTSAKFAAGAFDAVWSVATRTLTAISDSSGVTTLLSRIVGTLASGTHNPQSGDCFARIGPPVTGQTTLMESFAVVNNNLTIVEAYLYENIPGAVWDLAVSSHTFGGTFGQAVNNLTTAVDNLPTNTELATALGTADDAILTAIANLNDISPAEVNAEVLDVLNVDTFPELSAPPPATSSLKDKLTWLFMWARNKATQTSTQRRLYADNGTTVVGTETVSDDGTTYTKGEVS